MFEIHNYLTLRWDLQPCCSVSSTFGTYHTYKAYSHKHLTCPYKPHLHELIMYTWCIFSEHLSFQMKLMRIHRMSGELATNKKTPKPNKTKTSLVNTVHSMPHCIKHFTSYSQAKQMPFRLWVRTSSMKGWRISVNHSVCIPCNHFFLNNTTEKRVITV